MIYREIIRPTSIKYILECMDKNEQMIGMPMEFKEEI